MDYLTIEIEIAINDSVYSQVDISHNTNNNKIENKNKLLEGDKVILNIEIVFEKKFNNSFKINSIGINNKLIQSIDTQKINDYLHSSRYIFL